MRRTVCALYDDVGLFPYVLSLFPVSYGILNTYTHIDIDVFVSLFSADTAESTDFNICEWRFQTTGYNYL